MTVSHKESECDQSHLHGQPGSVLSVLDPEVGMGVWIHCGSVLYIVASHETQFTSMTQDVFSHCLRSSGSLHMLTTSVSIIKDPQQIYLKLQSVYHWASICHRHCACCALNRRLAPPFILVRRMYTKLRFT